MARKETVVNRITSFDESWDNNHTGQEVEDFITTKLIEADNNQITGAKFVGTTLTLEKKGADPIDVQVVIAEPTYTYNIYVYGLVLNGDYSNIKRTGDTLITQYSSGKTFHLGVAFVAYTDTVGSKNNITAAQPITISYGNNNSANFNIIPIDYQKVVTDSQGVIIGLADGVDPLTNLAWLDITSLFTESRSGQITASYSIESKSEGQYKLFEGSYTLGINNINNEVVNLFYNGSIINGTTIAQFTTDSDNSQYKLEGWIYKNGVKEVINLPTLEYPSMVAGLNQFIVRAVNKNNTVVSTDYITIDVICTVDLNRGIIAVNDVRNTIANNGVATLYNLTVYSPTGTDEMQISTYVADQDYQNLSIIPDSALVKQDIITDTSYTQNDGTVFSTSYQKYMEIGGGGEQYLYIKIGDNNWYNFLTQESGDSYVQNSQRMTVEPLNQSLTYYANGVSLSFDQIKGCLNNVFKTKEYYPNAYNVNTELEISDGWIEEGGRNIFRVTAQDTPVLNIPLALNLQDQFTLEFGFKTYNISDEHKPILTIGNLQLRPLELCWDVNKTADEELKDTVFTARNSQFQENVETHILVTVKKGATIQDEGIYYPNYLDQYGSQEALNTLNQQSINLVRIFINGVIDREFILQDSELNALKNASLQINPKGCDVDFYLLRVYNAVNINFEQVKRNYLSFLKNKQDKLDFYNANDILGNNGEISFNKCRDKYNTIVYVFPAGQKKVLGTTNDSGRFPNRAWGYNNNSPEQDNVMKSAHVSIFVNYADAATNRIYGGRLNHIRCKSQGSSAERYLIWNVGSAMDKFKNNSGKKIKSMFTPYSNLNESNRFATHVDETNYYVMPKYDGEADETSYKAKKLVGKVNFASSMQSHKQGACRLFDDAYKKILPNNMPKTVAEAQYGSKKAVHQEAFLYFYWEPNMTNDEVANCDLADIIAAGQNVKFMGFHTWGPGKGDKAYFGYSDYTPEYIIIEGDENKDPAANFQVPWHALQRANEEHPTEANMNTYALSDFPTVDYNPDNSAERLVIYDENICYNGRSGAFAVDFGLKDDPEAEAGPVSFWEFTEPAKISLNKFRAFHDFVYKYDYTYVLVDDQHNNPETWNPIRKYCVSSNSFPYLQTTYNGLYSHSPGDIYRYESYSGKWVPAGIKYDRTTNKWDSINLRTLSGSNQQLGVDIHRKNIKNTFLNGISQFVNLNDAAFHQAFVKFLSGTDNRAKNTYYQIVGPLYKDEVIPAVYYTQEEINNAIEGDDAFGKTTEDIKIPETTQIVKGEVSEDAYSIRFLGDDLDTILVTDNNGLQTKPYNLLEASYDESLSEYWGDAHNLFYYMFDQCYESLIKSMLEGILREAFSNNNNVDNKGTYFYKQFFNIQENQFPAIAYNHTAKIYYENAQFIYDSHIIDVYTNNGVEVPLSQSHGSSVACEKQFMQKRYNFLKTYVKQGAEGSWNFVDSSGGSGASSVKIKLTFQPYQDFYPTYYWQQESFLKYIAELDNTIHEYQDNKHYMPVSIDASQFDTLRYLAKAGKEYTTYISESTQSINGQILSTSLYKTINIAGINNGNVSPVLTHITDFKMDNNSMTNDDFFNGRALMSIDQFRPSAPVLENLSLRNITLPTEVDLSNYVKLKRIDFTGTNVTSVILPQSGRLQTIILPETITEFRIYNNPGLKVDSTIIVEDGEISEGVILPNPAGLRIVYINGSKSGKFNLEKFCKELVQANLSQITLRDININMTESTLNYLLAVPKCLITGKITIVNNEGSKAPISFSTLQSLVNKFGNIRSKDNSLYVDFTSQAVQTVKAPATLALYTPGDKAQIIPIIETGNDVKIIDDNGTARLDITFYLRSSNTYGTSTNLPSSIATIDSKTGIITLVSTSTTPGYIFIKVGTTNGDKNTSTQNSCQVTFQWVAPKVGDFAYEDGTFSSSFISSKALMGLVYAVKNTTSENGTAYIIGKEYAFDTPVYSNYTGETGALKNGSAYEVSTYYLRRYAKELLGISDALFTDGLANVNRSVQDEGGVNAITYDNYGRTISNDEFIRFTGKADTEIYINAVNRYVLPKLQIFYSNTSHPSSNITNNLTSYGSDGYYRINNKTAFDAVYNALANMNIKYNDSVYDDYSSYVYSGLATSVIFPYVYAIKVYQPVAASLDVQYEAGNWYMPSMAQLQRVLYYRGVSARAAANADFNNPSYVRLEINGDAVAPDAIFSAARKAMGNTNFPNCWQQLVGFGNTVTAIEDNTSNANNLTTLLGPTGNNYGYQCTTGNTNDWYVSNSWTNKWIYGKMPEQNSNGYTTYIDYPGSYLTWALCVNKHQGIPFVEYNYSKPV